MSSVLFYVGGGGMDKAGHLSREWLGEDQEKVFLHSFWALVQGFS